MKRTVTVLALSAVFSCLAADGNFVVSTNDATVTVKAVVNTIPTLTLPFFGETVSKVVFDTSTNSFRYNPTEASTYEGGSEIPKGQLVADRGDAFGYGPITIGTTGMAALMARDRDVTIPNKVVFNRSDAYAVGFGNTLGCLTLKSIGTGDSAYRTVRLGREGVGSVGRVTLSLTDDESEAVRQFGLQGALRLRLDGGTVKAASDAENPFFRIVTQGDVADITVAAAGVTFDVPEGASIDLGQPLKFESAAVTNLLGSSTVNNASFENGLSGGWKYETLYGGESDSAVKSVPCAWDENGKYPPPDGSKYAMIRQGVSLSTAVEVPEDGAWRVVFWRGGRPNYSLDVGLSVVLGGATNEFPKSSVCDFVECRTAPVNLSAGTHTLAFITSNAGQGHSLNIDNVSLERVELETVVGRLTKVGSGSLVLDEHGFTGGIVSVKEGTVGLRGVALESNTAIMEVESGATLSLSAFGKTIVDNGGFEADGQKDYSSQTKPRNWSLKSGTSDGWGLQMNGGTLTANGPLTSQGSVTVFMREGVTICQKVTSAVSGTYRLSFLAADRKFATSHKMPIQVTVDGAEAFAVGVRDSYSDFTSYSVDIELAAGEHEIAFATGLVGQQVTLGNIVLIDDVSLRQIRSTDIAVGCAINLKTGATLELDVPGRVYANDVSVDGVRFTGGRAALVRSGVSVTGAGRLCAGNPKGFVIGLR